jgi:prevent-host-death family protein
MAERTVSATEARVHFGDLLESVQRGDVVFVERAGKPVAVVVSAEEWHRRSDPLADRWAHSMAALDEFHDYLQGKYGPAGIGNVDIEEEIRAGREERARQIDDLLR